MKSTVMKVENVNLPAEGSYLLGLIPKTGANDSRSSTSVIETNTSTIQCGQDRNQDSGRGLREAASSLANHSSTICPAVMNVVKNSNSVSSRASVLLSADECYNCHYIGHRAQDCPRKIKTKTPTALTGQHSSANCPTATNDLVNTSRLSPGASVVRASDECYKCHCIGHWARDCPNSAPSYGSSGVSSLDECYKCHCIGHWARDCPNSAPPYGSSGVSFKRRRDV